MMNVTKELLSNLAISDKEYQSIVEQLGRIPNELELGMFGSLWSEHCGYKHSKLLLKMLESSSSKLLVTQGEENAGVVDIGDNLAVVFKIESHNHPSAVEPYEGAATGVGGIVRDILAMGARPIALLNSLRFGPISEPHNRFLFQGVVSGISGYGNCIGIPNVGGEIYFSKSYTENPIVNAMCVGIVDKENLVKAAAGDPGNLLLLVGSETGRDGIHGASGLASKTFEDDRELRPTVQVGNPFLEKILIEACLEIASSDCIVGIQDLGAAGLVSSCVESADRSGAGFEIDVANVPRRDKGLTPYEVMLSESQERMIIIVKKGHLEEAKNIFHKWGLTSTIIGKVTGNGLAKILENGETKGEIPIKLLSNPPLYKLNGIKPKWLSELQNFDLQNLPIPNKSPSEILLSLLGSPNISSKKWVYQQYDHQVQTNTVIGPGIDSAILRIKNSSKGIALNTDGNGRYCYLDPYVGGIISVAEACRNISSIGAEPVAITDCLNFGNPEKPEIYYQLEQCIKGIALSSKILNVPVVSGNVSLYNETRNEGIYPTPIIGVLGLIQDVNQHVTLGFKKHGDIVIMIGDNHIKGDPNYLSGSEYLEMEYGLVAGKPYIDINLELKIQKTCRKAIQQGLLNSAHDCSDGGLAIALAECCIVGGKGFQGSFSITERWDSALFGENQSRIIVSTDPDNLSELKQLCLQEEVPWTHLGIVTGNTLSISEHVELDIEKIGSVWQKSLENSLS